MHEPFEANGIPRHVEEEVAVERFFHLNAADVEEFGSFKPPSHSQIGEFSDA